MIDTCVLAAETEPGWTAQSHLLKATKGLIGRTRSVWADFGGREARPVAGLEGSLKSASDATLLGSVGEESSGLLICEPF
jgi:hypothetical protein